MYLSIDFNIKNIYLYHKNNGPVICKSNFVYKITSNEIYNKISCILTNKENRDNLQIFDNNKIKITINSSWCLKKFNQTFGENGIKRNILIPNINDINLFSNHVDLNSINCLCHDNTHIINIPDILISFGSTQYSFVEWTGNNQVWCSVVEDDSYYVYAYLFIFAQKSILLVSQTSKDINNNFLDLDISSIYNHENIIQDEYGRIDCYNYNPIFSNIHILNNPINRSISNEQITIETQQCHTV